MDTAFFLKVSTLRKPYTLVGTQESASAVHIQLGLVHVQTVRIVGSRRAHDINILDGNVGAHSLARAHEHANIGVIVVARGARQVLDKDIRDNQRAGVLQAQRQVLLAIALGDFNGIVDIVNNHPVVCDVVHNAGAAAALQIARERRRRVGPHLDARAIAGIVHANVGHIDVFDNVVFAHVLAQRADADAVRAVAPETLDEDVGGVGFEGDAV